jgi:hypothetical protein
MPARTTNAESGGSDGFLVNPQGALHVGQMFNDGISIDNKLRLPLVAECGVEIQRASVMFTEVCVVAGIDLITVHFESAVRTHRSEQG